MKLSAAERKALPAKQFAIPAKRPGAGSYPINDRSHARNALARSSGKPVAGAVRAKVRAKYPDMGMPGMPMLKRKKRKKKMGEMDGDE